MMRLMSLAWTAFTQSSMAADVGLICHSASFSLHLASPLRTRRSTVLIFGISADDSFAALADNTVTHRSLSSNQTGTSDAPQDERGQSGVARVTIRGAEGRHSASVDADRWQNPPRADPVAESFMAR
jgi:hypothetical protein